MEIFKAYGFLYDPVWSPGAHRLQRSVHVHQLLGLHAGLVVGGGALQRDHHHRADVLRQSRGTQEIRGVLRGTERRGC